jgi:hypothetical protein
MASSWKDAPLPAESDLRHWRPAGDKKGIWKTFFHSGRQDASFFLTIFPGSAVGGFPDR